MRRIVFGRWAATENKSAVLATEESSFLVSIVGEFLFIVRRPGSLQQEP